MTAGLPSDAELDALAQQVDEQLSALQSGPAVAFRGGEFRGAGPDALPGAPDQQALIEKVTGQPFETFWHKYLRHLRKDLCLPGGMLYEQWHKWRDLESKSAVKMAYGVLVGMGIPTVWLAPVAVAATVFLLNLAVKVGIDAVCEGCQPEGEDPDGTQKKSPGKKPKSKLVFGLREPGPARTQAGGDMTIELNLRFPDPEHVIVR